MMKLILYLIFSLYYSLYFCIDIININVRHNEDLSLYCTLESGKLADDVRIYSVGKGSNKLLANLTVSDSNRNSCYCGNPEKKYLLLQKNSSKEDEGRYTCIFYFKNNETAKHYLDVRVTPMVTTTSYRRDYIVFSVCNITKPFDLRSLSAYMIVSGVKVDCRNINTITRYYLEPSHFDYYLMTDLRYPDSVKEIICLVEYAGLSNSYKISTHIGNVSDSEKFINETLLNYDTDKSPLLEYRLDKVDNYTLPGKPVSLRCKFELLYNETIDKVVWKDDDPYNSDIITISDDTIHYRRSDYRLTNDGFIQEEEEDLDISDTSLLINNPKVDHGKCYNAKATIGKYYQECNKCLLVGNQVFFEWRRIGDDKDMVTCYMGGYSTPGIIWRVGGTRINGIMSDKVHGSIYGECKKCIASTIIINKKANDSVTIPYCSNWVIKEYAKEYPIDYSKLPQNKLFELTDYRISKEKTREDIINVNKRRRYRN
ncbi:SWPV1-011 [Shearwaterpox virus]|uniref:SWPV1-011 n=1 Tax=Shearwaterpox virus TaxID=1974596 RepID=A0A1V0QGR9_CNPV|nr:SWPV1-011 [Shearwaterpox virus]